MNNHHLACTHTFSAEQANIYCAPPISLLTCLLDKLDKPDHPPAQYLFNGELIIRGSTTL